MRNLRHGATGIRIFGNVNANYARGSLSTDTPWYGASPEDDFYNAENDMYTLINFQIGCEWRHLGLHLISGNIFDEEHIVKAYVGEQSSRPVLALPRQVSCSFRGHF